MEKKVLLMVVMLNQQEVRINLADGKTLVRFCDPDKVEDVVVNDTWTGKKYNNISSQPKIKNTV